MVFGVCLLKFMRHLPGAHIPRRLGNGQHLSGMKNDGSTLTTPDL